MFTHHGVTFLSRSTARSSHGNVTLEVPERRGRGGGVLRVARLHHVAFFPLSAITFQVPLRHPKRHQLRNATRGRAPRSNCVGVEMLRVVECQSQDARRQAFPFPFLINIKAPIISHLVLHSK